MAKKQWEPGNAISKKIAGWTYYAPLLVFPWVAFYHHRTKKLVEEFDEIIKKDVLFTIAAHKTLVAKGRWTSIGHRPVEKGLRLPRAQAIWDDAAS